MKTIVSLMSVLICCACGGGEQSDEERLRELCDVVSVVVESVLDDCGVDVPLRLQCSAATSAEREALSRCAADIAAVACAEVEAGVDVPSCDGVVEVLP